MTRILKSKYVSTWYNLKFKILFLKANIQKEITHKKSNTNQAIQSKRINKHNVIIPTLLLSQLQYPIKNFCVVENKKIAQSVNNLQRKIIMLTQCYHSGTGKITTRLTMVNHVIVLQVFHRSCRYFRLSSNQLIKNVGGYCIIK